MNKKKKNTKKLKNNKKTQDSKSKANNHPTNKSLHNADKNKEITTSRSNIDNKKQRRQNKTRLIIAGAIIIGLLILWQGYFSKSTGSVTQNSAFIAEVNGKGISYDEFNKELDIFLFTSGMPKAYASQISKSAFLNQTILHELIYQEAVKNNNDISTQEAEDALEKSIKNSALKIEDIKEKLKNENISYDDFIEYNRKVLAMNRQINESALKDIKISDKDVREYYDSNTDSFATGEKIRVSHILVNTSDEAKQIIAQLDGGEDFAELAKEKSIGPSAPQGGDLNYFGRDQMVKPFEDAAFSLKDIGDYTKEPVETRFGYHIIRLTGRKEASATGFDDAKDTIKSQLLQDKQISAFETYLEELRKKSDVKIYLKEEPKKGPEPIAASSAAKTAGLNIPKTRKPIIELFVMSYCPYGTQIEKGIIPVIETLKDKIDFEIKFCDYAMHGKKELDEQAKQYCIQKEQNAEYLDYLNCFLKEGNSDQCIEDIGIDNKKLKDCIKSTDNTYKITENYNDRSTWKGSFPVFNVYAEEVSQYNIQGSPTLVINGVTAKTARDSSSLLDIICAAFSIEPEECSQKLSSTSPTPGFGFSKSTGNTAPEGGCTS